MVLWGWLIGASLLTYLIKLSGFLVPHSLLERPEIVRIAGTMTIGLLASLVMMNALGDGQAIAFDARIAALAAGAGALILRAPFIVVVIAGAVAAAACRLLGMP